MSVRMLVACLVGSLVLCAAASAQPAHATKLSPTETAWVKPLLVVWTNMNNGLQVVLKQATASNALSPGTAANGKLTKTLAEFASCSALVKKAGAPPTARVKAFDVALTSMCVHLGKGANDLAKAIGAVGKGNSALAAKEIKAMESEFASGSTSSKQAAAAIVSVGGSTLPTA